jgi:hypothetical protein
MADRAAARAWREDVESRTTPVGDRLHRVTDNPRRRATDGAATRLGRPASERALVHPMRRASDRPQLSLVVTRTDDEAPRRDPQTGRRTIAITGQRAAPAPRRRPDTASRVGPRPDRIAMWAFFMGIFLVAVSTATADAAPL